MLSGQDILTYSGGIGLILGTIKLIRFIAGRRDREDLQPEEGESVRDYKDRRDRRDRGEDTEERLFPNGERDKIVKMINQLRAENIARCAENDEARIFRENTEAALLKIAKRLDSAGI